MIKDERPYIKFEDEEIRCYFAGYVNQVQHKWRFVIDGIDNEIFTGSKIKFFGIEFTVTCTIRKDSEEIILKNRSGTETIIEAWIV